MPGWTRTEPPSTERVRSRTSPIASTETTVSPNGIAPPVSGAGIVVPRIVVFARLPLHARSPAGYPEVASSWIDPGAMIERIGAAFALARGAVRGSALGTVGAVAEPRAIALCTPEALWT